MMKLQVFWLTFANLLVLFEAAKLPPFLSQCKEGNSAALNRCFERNANRAIRDVIKGGLHYDIPPMNPIRYLDSVSLIESNLFSVTFSNIDIFGLAAAKISNVDLNFKRRTFQMIISVPNLVVTGNYETNGDFFGINIQNNGQFIKNITMINILYTFTFNLQKQFDGDYFRITTAKADFNFAQDEFNLEGLFRDQNYIVSDTGDNLYDAFISRLQQLIQEKMIFVNRKISEFLTTVFEGIFSRVPRHDIFIQPKKVISTCEKNNLKPNSFPEQISSLLNKLKLNNQKEDTTD